MRIRFLWPAIGACLGLSAFFWSASGSPDQERTQTFDQLELYAEILARIESEYVTPVDEGEVIEASIDGMLSSLDPHSGYLDADDMRNLEEKTSGQYGGLGIEVTSEEGFVLVIAPMDDTPASRAGIQSGDYLSAINGDSIVGLSLDDAVERMRGDIATDITVTVLREGIEPFDVTLTREIIRPKSVTFRVEGTVGYIRISEFNELTTSGLEDAIRTLKKDIRGGMSGVVLDLRNNPGGLLKQAISVSSTFLNGGEVVSTRGRRPDDVQRYNARRGEKLAGVPIVVLINNGSASAAEIVAGALQDHNRATIMGETSFGKGSVQSVIPLGTSGEKGGIRLTTSRYYTPSNASIQGAGIEPDIEVSAKRLTEEEMENIAKRAQRFSEASLPNALTNDQGRKRRGPHVPDNQPPADYDGDDYQLDHAIEFLTSQVRVKENSRKG